MEHDFAILSPEKTILTYRLAGLGTRIMAHLIDVILLVGLMVALLFALAFTIFRLDPTAGTGLYMFLTFAVPLLYFVLLEGLWNGQTLGKKTLSIRVRMADGTPVTFFAAMGRNFLRPADMLPGPYFVGLLATFTNPKAQRLGDLVANTVVCHEKRPTGQFAIAPHAVGVHPLEQYIGDLRGMTPEEYYALRRLADRFPELPESIQRRMITEVWEPVAERRNVAPLPNVHPVYLVEAVVMKYGRQHGNL